MVVRAGRLLGRQREVVVLERLLDTARDGHGAVLVVHGDPGVGKTALLEYAVEAADDFRVVRAAGVEGEMELDYAALQQLCSPILGFIERLPDPQRDALRVAFGLSAGQAPSPFLVGLAVLGLLSEAAERQPILSVVDDAQWLDGASARALAFVARRLLAERIALAFATRDAARGWARFSQLRVDPLGRRDARALLDSVLAARLDESVLERIVAETGGNPLALLELPRGLTPAQLAGGFGLPAALPLSSGIEQSFRRRLARLPRDARRLLLLAAAEPVGDPALLWRAAQQLGITETAAYALESEGLLTLDGVVALRHPLVRSAVYGAAEPNARREAHRALAEATDPQIDPDRRAWHRAQAASVPDEALATELERSAARAQARGGFAAAAAFLERAATLTPAPVHRAQRALVAAQTKFRAGALDDALGLLSSTEVAVLDELDHARVDLLRAQIAFVSTHGSDAPAMLLAAARRLTPLSPALACETYLEALSAAMFAGRLAAPGATVLDVARAAKAAPRPPVLGGLPLRYPLGERRPQRPEPAAHEFPRQRVLFLQCVGAEGGVQLDQAGDRAVALGRLDDHAHGGGVRRGPVPGRPGLVGTVGLHQQLVAGGEVVPQRRVGHPDRLGHRPQRGPVHAALREQGDHVVQDLLPAPHPLRVRAATGGARGCLLRHPAIVGAGT